MRRCDHIVHGNVVLTNRNFREKLALETNANLNGRDVRQETVVVSTAMPHTLTFSVESHSRNDDNPDG